MKPYTKKILTWVMAIALLVGTILTDYRLPLSSKAEGHTVINTESQSGEEGASESNNAEQEEQAAETQEEHNVPQETVNTVPQDITNFVDVKLETLDIIDYTEKTEYSYMMENGKIKSLKVTDKKQNSPTVTEYIMSGDGKLLDSGGHEFPGLLLNQWSRVDMKWGWGVTEDNMPHVKQGNYFRIKLPAHITNTGKKFPFRTPDGKKMGEFIVKNDFLTATFTEENKTYEVDELKNGFFKVAEEIKPVDVETEVTIEHQQDVILKLKIKEKPNPNGGNSGTPGPKPPYNPGVFPNVFDKEGGQGNWHIRNGAVWFKFSVNHDKIDEMFTNPDNVPVTKNVFLDDYDFPSGLEIDANSFDIRVPLYAAADSDVNKPSNYILNHFWGYHPPAADAKIRDSFTLIDKKQDVNDKNLKTKESFREYIKAEFTKNNGKPIIGIWDKRYLVIAFGDLPTSAIKYGELNTHPNGTGETIAQTIDRLERDRKLRAEQATKLRQVYAPDKAVAIFNISFVAYLTDADKTEFENKATLHYDDTEIAKTKRLEQVQHQEGGVEGGLDYVNLKVVKEWVGKKKASANFKLIAKVEDKVIDELGESFTLNDSTGWTKEFKDKRAKHGALHKRITYSIEEEKPKGYDVDVKRDTPEAGLILWTVKNIRRTVDIPVKKLWKDTDGSALTPPTDIKIQVVLKQNGTVKDRIELPKADGSWEHIFEDVEETDDNGDLYVYTVEEEPVEGFKKDITADSAKPNGFIITNTKIPLITIEVDKKWVRPGNNNDELPNTHKSIPESIEVQLIRKGFPDQIVETRTLTKAEGWKGTFKPVPSEDSKGNPIQYAVKEKEAANGFALAPQVDVKKNKATLINALNKRPISITVDKKWIKGNTELNDVTETEVLVDVLYRKKGSTDQFAPYQSNLKVEKSKDWKLVIDGLPEIDPNGEELEYDVREATVPNGYYASKEGGPRNFILTNTVIPKREIKVVKKWLGEDGNELGSDYLRIPARIKVKLWKKVGANGTWTDTAKVLTLTKAANWTGSFTGLDTVNSLGEPITYRIEEVQGTAEFANEFTNEGTKVEIANGVVEVIITNKKTKETVEIKVYKKWLDLNNSPITDQNRLPDGVKFSLFADGQFKKAFMVSKANGWFYTESLPKFDVNGKEIVYTIKETDLYGYTVTIQKENGGFRFTATNKETPTPPNPFIPPLIPDEPVPTPPNTPTPPPPNVPTDELVIEDDAVVLADNEVPDPEDPKEEQPDEEITDDLPKQHKEVPKTADYLMDGFANPLAVGTVMMLGYGIKKMIQNKKKK